MRQTYFVLFFLLPILLGLQFPSRVFAADVCWAQPEGWGADPPSQLVVAEQVGGSVTRLPGPLLTPFPPSTSCDLPSPLPNRDHITPSLHTGGNSTTANPPPYSPTHA